MANHEDERPTEAAPDQTIAEKLQAALSELQGHNQEIDRRRDAIADVGHRLRGLLGRVEITEEIKYLVAALDGRPGDYEATAAYMEKLAALDAEIQAAAGQTVAWVSGGEVVVSRPMNPAVQPSTEHRYEFHVGMLPYGAKLEVESPAGVYIPIEKSVAVPIVAFRQDIHRPRGSRALTLDAGSIAIQEPRGFAEIEDDELQRIIVPVENNPRIKVTDWDRNVPYPVALGNEAVGAVFDANQLEGNRYLNRALQSLTTTLF